MAGYGWLWFALYNSIICWLIVWLKDLKVIFTGGRAGFYRKVFEPRALRCYWFKTFHHCILLQFSCCQVHLTAAAVLTLIMAPTAGHIFARLSGPCMEMWPNAMRHFRREEWKGLTFPNVLKRPVSVQTGLRSFTERTHALCFHSGPAWCGAINSRADTSTILDPDTWWYTSSTKRHDSTLKLVLGHCRRAVWTACSSITTYSAGWGCQGLVYGWIYGKVFWLRCDMHIPYFNS